jgi:microcystin-dependent protein
MAELYLGQIIQGGWNFAPRGTHHCDGALLSIAQNNALFALVGTTFGGDGQATFGLPDLRGRSMIGQGRGPNLQPYGLGQRDGTETAKLTIPNMPTHAATATFTQTSGVLNVSSAKATAQVAENGSVLAKSVDTAKPANAVPAIYAPSGTATEAALAGVNVAGTVVMSPIGSSTPFGILSPYLAVTAVIVTEGIFPSRN